MYVVVGEDDTPATLLWATKDAVYSSILDAVPDVVPATPAPSASPAGSGEVPSGSAPASAAP
jgi:hypothetical protein